MCFNQILYNKLRSGEELKASDFPRSCVEVIDVDRTLLWMFRMVTPVLSAEKAIHRLMMYHMKVTRKESTQLVFIIDTDLTQIILLYTRPCKCEDWKPAGSIQDKAYLDKIGNPLLTPTELSLYKRFKSELDYVNKHETPEVYSVFSKIVTD